MTRRLVLASVLIAAFVLLIVEVPLGLTYAGRAQDRLLADVERDARVMAGLVEERVEAGDQAGVATVAERYSDQTGGRVVVTDASGVSLIDTESTDAEARDFSTRPEMAAALDGSQATGIRTSATLGQELAYATVPISSDGDVTGVVRVSFPTEEMRERVRDNWLRLALLSVLVLAAAASFGWVIAQWAVAPIEQLEAGARQLASGDLGGRTKVDRGPPELRRLSRTFDEMAVRIESLVGAQQAFVADASHQLRTPLTVLRLRVESMDAAIDSGADPETLRHDVDAVGTELERLMRVVEGLLALARAEGAATVSEVDVAACARSAHERWDALAEEEGVSISVDAPATAAATAVPGAIDQVLDNLLDNAIEVTPVGTPIVVTVTETDGQVVLVVRDHGPGLGPEDLERATERFWRGPDAEPGGTGLGLAIAAELTRASGGSVTLRTPEPGPGLQVEVRLPSA